MERQPNQGLSSDLHECDVMVLYHHTFCNCKPWWLFSPSWKQKVLTLWPSILD